MKHPSCSVYARVVFFCSLLSCLALSPAGAAGLEGLQALPQDAAMIVVDNASTHQVLEGFGATTHTLVYGQDDFLTPALRDQAIDAVYGQVQLNMGSLQMGNFESAGNDDADPFTYNWDGFDWSTSVAMKEKVIDLAEPLGFDNYHLSHVIDLRWKMPWLKAIRSADYDRYLDECAEHIVAGLIYWRDTYGIVPRYMQPFNEPLSGNWELEGGTPHEMIDIIKRAGQRMADEGFGDVKFIVPSEERERKSWEVASAILADPEARQYVGVIAYHPYPYGSTYSSVRRILETSGAGTPEAGKVDLRNLLRNLGAQYGLPVWMNEVSMGPGNIDYPFGSFENLRARAIHIHDELVYANVAAYYGMLNMWDLWSHEGHFGNRDLLTTQSTMALIDNETDEVFITGMGYAIGHYARWVPRGAVRIEASSTDPLLQVTAFRDDAQKRIVLVLINNTAAERPLQIDLNAVSVGGTITGEQSTETTRWQPLTPFEPTGTDEIVFSVPALSVTSMAVPLAGTGGGAAPSAPQITSPAAGAQILVGGTAQNPVSPHTSFEVVWTGSTDPDGDPITYTWELADTDNFANVLVSVPTGIETQYRTDFASLNTLLSQQGVAPGGSLTLYHRVVASDGQFSTPGAAAQVTLIRGVLTATEGAGEVPAQVVLFQNYPNPFNPATTIQFALRNSEHVTLKVFDVLGREVATLVDKTMPAGTHVVAFEAADVESGVYFYHLETPTRAETRRMVVLK